MQKYPEPVVGVFVRDAEGKVLLFRSYKWEKGQIWVVCGGHIEWGESIEQAVRRETKEEAGIEVEYVRLITTFEGIFPPIFHKKKHFIYLQCEARIKPGEIVKIDNKELQEYRWFSLKEARKLNNHPMTQKTLEMLYV